MTFQKYRNRILFEDDDTEIEVCSRRELCEPALFPFQSKGGPRRGSLPFAAKLFHWRQL